jgi:Flp pilus assembly protein TadD
VISRTKRIALLRKTGALGAVLLGLAASCWFTAGADAQSASRAVPSVTAAQSGTFMGSEACAKCHAKIFETYSQTAMARASGPATQDFLAGDFQHAASGVNYRVYEENGEAWLGFERKDTAELHGKRKLSYFIGSGHRGRTFLFADDGFVFESPINFYSQAGAAARGRWDMAPAFQNAKGMPLNLPAAASCLSCHTSNAQAPVAGTENKYASPLFAHGGITCERCHGAGGAHIARLSGVSAGSGTTPAVTKDASANLAIVNPAKLSAARRDAVCMQCHLEGNAAIEQPGRHLYQFQAGDELSDFVRYFVLTGDGKDGQRAVSQFEALAQSACKRASGDAITCTSCHDPHSSPGAGERVGFYRGKCMACHGEPFAAKHHAEQADCAKCHMPRLATADVAHTQATDHRILRVPLMPLQGVGSAFDSTHEPPAEPKLVRFPAGAADLPRDLALAWVALAGNSKFASEQAAKILPEALAKSPEDAAILGALAYREQIAGQLDKAREHYEHSLRLDPLSIDAASNLAVLEANAGHLDRAIALWKPAFERAPGRSALGMNLVRALCLSGHADQAQEAVTRVLEFNPDLRAGRSTLKQLQSGEAKCVVH